MIDKIHDNENNQSYVDFQKHEININTINSQNENIKYSNINELTLK